METDRFCVVQRLQHRAKVGLGTAVPDGVNSAQFGSVNGLTARIPSRRSAVLLLRGLLATAFALVPSTAVSPAQTPAFQESVSPLRTADLLKLASEFGSANPARSAYSAVITLAYERAPFQPRDVVAFEENPYFVYALAATGASEEAEQAPHRFRRVILLKPSTIVVEDTIQAPSSPQEFRWLLSSRTKPVVTKRTARLVDQQGVVVCETLFPGQAHSRVTPGTAGSSGAEHHLVVEGPSGTAESRFVHVLQALPLAGGSEAMTRMATRDGSLHLSVSTDLRDFQVTLPPVGGGAGDITVADRRGKLLLPLRPFPSGILPMGPEGMRLLDMWDSSYRGGHRPPWDAGRPSAELKRVVESGIISRGRAVDLGCGTGTDAVYLASKGFDVTAIDIAPTALSLAQERARKAGVKVTWLLADVLALPPMQPFDFLFDRGCYHEVRLHNAKAYVETVRKFSHPGSRFLLLAGNPNELPLRYAPPQVAEEDIRSDFSALFEFEWLRETRFETINPAIKPLAWSVMLRRK
ncbi:MAG: methyltransferase domain-containing protein [Acidobacteriota bacterium]